MNHNHNSSNKQCKDQLDTIRALDFAIQETALYLDAYPPHPEALKYYHALIEQRNKMTEAYERSCAPLTIYGNMSRISWDWIKGPWPWEPNAN